MALASSATARGSVFHKTKTCICLHTLLVHPTRLFLVYTMPHTFTTRELKKNRQRHNAIQSLNWAFTHIEVSHKIPTLILRVLHAPPICAKAASSGRFLGVMRLCLCPTAGGEALMFALQSLIRINRLTLSAETRQSVETANTHKHAQTPSLSFSPPHAHSHRKRFIFILHRAIHHLL